MYKRNSIKKLGRKSSHRKALIKNQLRSIIASGKVETSTAKAKVLKGELESVLSKIQKGSEKDLALIRELHRVFGSDDLVKKALEIGKKESLNITIRKVGFRSGDNTELSKVEIVGYKGRKKVQKKGEKKDVEKEEKKVEELPEEIQKGISNLGKKNIKGSAKPVRKERARSRSGL